METGDIYFAASSGGSDNFGITRDKYGIGGGVVEGNGGQPSAEELQRAAELFQDRSAKREHMLASSPSDLERVQSELARALEDYPPELREAARRAFSAQVAHEPGTVRNWKLATAAGARAFRPRRDA